MPAAEPKPRTLYDKVFQDHVVNEQEDGTIILYIGKSCSAHLSASSCMLTLLFPLLPDRHLVHEVTSPVCQMWLHAAMQSPLRHRGHLVVCVMSANRVCFIIASI